MVLKYIFIAAEKNFKIIHTHTKTTCYSQQVLILNNCRVLTKGALYRSIDLDVAVNTHLLSHPGGDISKLFCACVVNTHQTEAVLENKR